MPFKLIGAGYYESKMLLDSSEFIEDTITNNKMLAIIRDYIVDLQLGDDIEEVIIRSRVGYFVVKMVDDNKINYYEGDAAAIYDALCKRAEDEHSPQLSRVPES